MNNFLMAGFFLKVTQIIVYILIDTFRKYSEQNFKHVDTIKYYEHFLKIVWTIVFLFHEYFLTCGERFLKYK